MARRLYCSGYEDELLLVANAQQLVLLHPRVDLKETGATAQRPRLLLLQAHLAMRRADVRVRLSGEKMRANRGALGDDAVDLVHEEAPVLLR